MTRYRTVPVNVLALQAIVNLVEVVNPKSPTLFRVVLAKGGQLAPAAGGGFRGFATGAGGKISAQAVLTPVGVGGTLVGA